MWGIIATWRMALEGVTESASALAAGKPVAAAVVDAVAAVEDFPLYKSVGYGGLPTENGEVELDAAYMDGDTLAFGAVGIWWISPTRCAWRTRSAVSAITACWSARARANGR